VTSADAQPRGMTPLNDATGQIVSLAKAGINGVAYDKVAIIIMTDGLEDASAELSTTQAKALLDVCRAKGWQVTCLGANFDNAAQATQYGNLAAATVQASAPNLKAAMAETAGMRAAYAATGAPMQYSAEQKQRLRK